MRVYVFRFNAARATPSKAPAAEENTARLSVPLAPTVPLEPLGPVAPRATRSISERNEWNERVEKTD